MTDLEKLQLLANLATPEQAFEAGRADGQRRYRRRSQIDKLQSLARRVTIRQVIDAGDNAIKAAGLNPWCINEGLATGDETIDISHLSVTK
jgi:hypothetical protein